MTDPKPQKRVEEDSTPKSTLKRFLSVRTTSSSTESQQAAIETTSKFRCIGAGTCGRIFSVPGTNDIFKVALHPGLDTDKVWNDFQMHYRISEAFDKIGRNKLEVHIPRIKYFVKCKDTKWWNSNMHQFPMRNQQPQHPSNLLCAERIPPLAKPIRDSLIEEYCPGPARPETHNSEANQDCLARIYLGKRRERVNTRFFQLRNFPLHLDQMEDLELDVSFFAMHIADALAVLHWVVRIDANDVEFVLGSAPARTADPALVMPKLFTASEIQKMAPDTSTWAAHVDDFKGRGTHLWLLDFDKCRDFPPTRAGLEQLVKAFLMNDPYFPRPLATRVRDQQLWDIFRDRYLLTSAKFAQGEHSQLPGLFMDMVVDAQRERMAARSG